MDKHTPQPWPVAGRVALAIVLGAGVTACTEEGQRSADAVLAVFGAPGVEPPVYAEPEPAPECRPVFRVVECDEAGNEVWL